MAQKMIKKRPASKRPPMTTKPTSYGKGKIYFTKAKNAFRVYVRSRDRVEKHVQVGEPTPANKASAWQYACGLIESDPRP